MRAKLVKALIKKEFLDVLRDKKAVAMMILVPLILYPLIFFGTMAVMTAIQSGMEQNEYHIVVEHIEGVEGYDEIIAAVDEHNNPEQSEEQKEPEEVMDKLKVVRTGEIWNYEKACEALQKEEIDAYVRITSTDIDGRTEYQIVYVSSITNSSYAADILQSIIKKMNRVESERIINDMGLKAEVVLNPIVINNMDIASKEQTTGNLLGMVLPMILIISLLMGTMYPAIDTTAGEKERGTLETLLTLPVTNREIIFSKFVTVAAIGIFSALLNLVSMGLIGYYMVKLIGGMGVSTDSINLGSFIPAIVVTILAVLVFSLFISAITMCITAFAKSYKEANNYITPLTLVVMLTGYIAFIPNIDLDRNMALVPVANICLLIKNILSFKYDIGIIAIVLISNVIYAALAILFLSKIYDSEGVLFDEGRSGIQLFEKRSNMKKGGVPTTGDAWFIICVVLIAVLYFGSLLQLKFGLGGVLGTQLMILMIPLAVVLYTKRSLRKTYKLRKTSIVNFIAGVVLIFGALLLGVLLTMLTSKLFPGDASSAGGGVDMLLEGHGFPFVLTVVAIAPAICEELLFRGFIMSAFKSRYKTVATIILVSVVFGVYHLSIVRFFTTAFLGAMLAITAHYSKSIFPGMLMHFLNNAISVFQMFFPDTFNKAFPILSDETPGIMEIFIMFFVGVMLTSVGITILVIKNKEIKGNGIKKEQN